MRILFFIETLECGGAEKSIVSLLQSLDYSKVDVDLMLMRGGVFSAAVPDQVRVIPFPEPRGLRRLWRRICLARYSLLRRCSARARSRHAAELRWRCESSALPRLAGHYDVAVAYQQGLPTYYVASRVEASRRLAWVNIDLQGAGYDPAFNRPVYDRYDGIAAVSESLYNRLSAGADYLDPARLTTVYDILNVEVIRRMAAQTPAVPVDHNGRLRLVTVGRMAPQKNYPLAVLTAAELRRRGLDFSWTLVGGGDTLAEVRRLIDREGLNGHVHTVGMQPNPYPYMLEADIYVHTASFEGYGLTIAEAKILGRPVVSTDFAVVYDQIEHGRNGLICSMTPESLADAIITLANDRDQRERLARAVRAETNDTATTEVRKFYRLCGLDA